MSGIVRSVKKVFKKVASSAIGKIIIAVAVSYFTAGLGAAFLGATGLATGMSATMTTVLSHAISGSIAGGITSGLTGGDIGKGMLFGGVGGAVTGGVQSALGNYTTIPGQTAPGDAAGKIGVEQGVQSPGEASVAVQEIGPPANLDTSAGSVGVPAGSAANLHPSAGPADGFVGSAKGPGGSGGLLGGVGDWIEKNPTAATIGASTAIQGIGQGMMASGQAEAATEAAEASRRAEAEKLAGIRGSHEGMTGLLNPSTVAATRAGQAPRPTPGQRFDPSVYQGEYIYDPEKGRIIFVPNSAMA
jgi:hypothetical protein